LVSVAWWEFVNTGRKDLILVEQQGWKHMVPEGELDQWEGIRPLKLSNGDLLEVLSLKNVDGFTVAVMNGHVKESKIDRQGTHSNPVIHR
jgi:hypothetical protein